MGEQTGTSKSRRLRDWVTITQGALLLVAVILIGTLISGAGRPRAVRAQGPGGPGACGAAFRVDLGAIRSWADGAGAEAGRAVRQEQGRPSRPRRTEDGAGVAGRKWRRRPRLRWRTRGAADGRMATASPGRALKPADVKSFGNEPLYDPARPADDLPAVRERRLGAGARRVQQHRRRRAGRGDGRRQDLPERRRALPRHVVVLHGARGLEALAEPDVRLRRREAEPARLPHAEPAERQRRSDVRQVDALLGHRARLHSRRRRPTTCAS